MPFGQLIIGSPGAGKTTYCAGAQAFLHALDRPALVVNLDPANERRLLPYAPAVDINELISVADVMREFGLGPNVSVGENVGESEVDGEVARGRHDEGRSEENGRWGS